MPPGCLKLCCDCSLINAYRQPTEQCRLTRLVFLVIFRYLDHNRCHPQRLVATRPTHGEFAILRFSTTRDATIIPQTTRGLVILRTENERKKKTCRLCVILQYLLGNPFASTNTDNVHPGVWQIRPYKNEVSVTLDTAIEIESHRLPEKVVRGLPL